MIEFYLIGAFFSYRQYKKYIDYSFEYGIESIKSHKCLTNTNNKKKEQYEFNRNEFILVFLYNFLYTLFVIAIIIYIIYVFELTMKFFNKSTDYSDFVLLKQISSNNPKYDSFIQTPNLFIKTIVKTLAISFVLNMMFIQFLIFYRGKILESNKKIIKQDLNVVMMTSIIIFGFTFLFV